MQTSEIQSVKQRFGIIGISSALNRAIDVAVQVSATDLSVLITGESGVGKETFVIILLLIIVKRLFKIPFYIFRLSPI